MSTSLIQYPLDVLADFDEAATDYLDRLSLMCMRQGLLAGAGLSPDPVLQAGKETELKALNDLIVDVFGGCSCETFGSECPACEQRSALAGAVKGWTKAGRRMGKRQGPKVVSEWHYRRFPVR